MTTMSHTFNGQGLGCATRCSLSMSPPARRTHLFDRQFMHNAPLRHCLTPSSDSPPFLVHILILRPARDLRRHLPTRHGGSQNIQHCAANGTDAARPPRHSSSASGSIRARDRATHALNGVSHAPTTDRPSTRLVPYASMQTMPFHADTDDASSFPQVANLCSATRECRGG
jgi:hypothetical protein